MLVHRFELRLEMTSALVLTGDAKNGRLMVMTRIACFNIALSSTPLGIKLNIPSSGRLARDDEEANRRDSRLEWRLFMSMGARWDCLFFEVLCQVLATSVAC